MTTDDLAGILREHSSLFASMSTNQYVCSGCREYIGPLYYKTATRTLAAHQAAVIAAAGWVRLEDLIEWFETEDPETLNGDDREFECVAVYLRALKDWEPIE